MSYRNEFEKIIEDIRLEPNTPKEEFDSKILPLLQFISNNVPEQLFKFRECTEYSLDAFDKDELWLSKASLFNDLHDSLFFFDKSYILKTIEEMFSSGNMLALFEALRSGQVSLEPIRQSTPDVQQRISSIISSLDAKQLTDIVWDSIPAFSTFLDQCFYSIKESIRNSTKMVCLSESIKSPLMWAHYAENNKGFALGYDFRNNEITQCSNCPNRSCNNIKFATIYPVIYSDKRFNATSYGQWYVEQYLKNILGISEIAPYNDNFLFVKAALHKSSDWAYENEWRIICSTPNPAVESRDRYPIKKRPIAIYFGCQIPEIYRKMLINIADEKEIAKYQMYVKDYSSKYELDFEPIQ
ncbi:DUF2971 domain-containing protein [Ruminococcus sp. CLA-AA-H200]|uniref:DUF2971 domain-containing protein n=2 Tax=Oscillospiraceae TaxID=216572 RepID=A0ABS8G194_9FIRM|nr:DUF2971 domain-containing protein [Ruminococcus turbiniformis]MCC2256080.1 DUF2971 domain-containing protein [Ruminococcus turbiniformis]